SWLRRERTIATDIFSIKGPILSRSLVSPARHRSSGALNRAAAAQAPAPMRASPTNVRVSGSGTPQTPCRRVIKTRPIIPPGLRVVTVVAVRVVIRVIVVGVCEHRAEGKSSEPEPDGGAGTDSTPTPTTTCTCGPRHCRQPDSDKDCRRDGQPPASLPKEPSNDHYSLLSSTQASKINSGSEAAVAAL